MLQHLACLNEDNKSYTPRPRCLSNLETQRPKAVASQAQRERYMGPRVSKSLSYSWSRCLTDLEFKCGNLVMNQYKVIDKEIYLNLMVFSFMISLAHEMNTTET